MKNIKTIGIKLAVFTGALAATLGVVWIMGGTAKADVLTLQQSVEMAQADYDLSQKQGNDAIQSACKSWKELAGAKLKLAEAVKLPTTIDKAGVEAANCTDLKIPASF